MRSLLNRLAVGGALAALVPLTLSAQSLREQTARRSTPVAPAGVSQIVSINPVMPILGFFQGEYEARMQDNLAFAASASYTEFDNVRYTNLDAKLRLYPEERGLQGLGLAAGIGTGSARREAAYCAERIARDERCRLTEHAPTFSVEGHYQWLLGTKRSTAITMGGGVKRYFVSDANDYGIQRILPTVRVTVGYAFR
ncbi:MAG: hypothetical protein K2R93_10780 [Gemmatimonadaceae bacterium]|nr:hypothetical protein [Gemmatimonadaceae bacterium]